MHARLTRGVRPHLEWKQRTPLSSQVATGISWSSLSGLKGMKPPVVFVERTRDCSLGHAGKEGPHLVMTGASRGFSQGAVPGWGFSRDRTGSSGRLLWCHGSQVSMDVAWGSASLLSSHGRGIEPQDTSKKNSRGLSRGVAGNPGLPRLVPMTSGSLVGFL